MIAAAHVSRTYGRRVALADFSLEVARGEIVALVGPNGAGKTTTMRLMAGLIAPTEGTISIDGTPLTSGTAGASRRRIGFLTEAPGLWDRLTVGENLRVHARLHAVADVEASIIAVLDRLGLLQRLNTRAAELSKGMRQKVALARALLHRPAVLLLDEPTSGLDPQVTREVRDLLSERRSEGCAILVSTHNLGEVERIADRVAILQTRLLAVDRPSALRTRVTTAAIVVRLDGAASAFGEIARSFDPRAEVDADTLTIGVRNIDADTPNVVRSLVDAGARIVEVRPTLPDLEDAYLHVVANGAGRGGAR